MVTWGILLMVASFLVTCTVGMSRAGHGTDPTLTGFEAGQSPLFLLGFGAGVALIAIGAAKKANATREQRERHRQAAMTTELVPSDKVPGGPFRGALEEVHKPSPAFEAMEASEHEDRKRRGTVYLTIGGVILGVTTIGFVLLMGGDKHMSTRARFDHLMLTFGGALIPFGIGLWLTIKGGIMRSKG
jgi:hypothetical protein